MLNLIIVLDWTDINIGEKIWKVIWKYCRSSPQQPDLVLFHLINYWCYSYLFCYWSFIHNWYPLTFFYYPYCLKLLSKILYDLTALRLSTIFFEAIFSYDQLPASKFAPFFKGLDYFFVITSKLLLTNRIFSCILSGHQWCGAEDFW